MTNSRKFSYTLAQGAGVFASSHSHKRETKPRPVRNEYWKPHRSIKAEQKLCRRDWDPNASQTGAGDAGVEDDNICPGLLGITSAQVVSFLPSS